MWLAQSFPFERAPLACPLSNCRKFSLPALEIGHPFLTMHLPLVLHQMTFDLQHKLGWKARDSGIWSFSEAVTQAERVDGALLRFVQCDVRLEMRA